jgi:hypothetical protein
LNATLIVTIIVASLSFLGTVLLGLIQTRNSRSNAKKTDVEAYTILVDSITKRTDTEFNIMKGVNITLKEQIEVLQKEKLELQIEIKDLEERLEKCEQCLKEDK